MSNSNPNSIDEQEEESTDLVGVSGGSNAYDVTHSNKKLAFQQLHPNIKEQLNGNTWEIIRYSPLNFIIAHSEYKQIVDACIQNEEKVIRDAWGNDTGEHETIPCLKLHNIIIDAIPVEIIVHENPLSLLEQRYTIKFSTYTGKLFSVGPKRLEEIVSILRERALILISRGASEALSAIINAFAKDEKIIIDEEVNTAGFYFIGGRIRSYKTIHTRPSTESIKKCVDLLDILQTKYKHKETFPSIVKWAIVAPFDYAFKQINGTWIPWLHLYGWTNTGKTTSGDIVCAIWGHYLDKNYKIPFTNMDTVAKFGEALSKSTYPIAVNEVGSLAEDRYRSLAEMFKTAIESLIARSKFIFKTHYTEIPSYSVCIQTSNAQPPTDPGYRRRVIPIGFTQSDEHTQLEKEQFDRLMREHVSGELKILGDFAANYILDNQQVLIFSNKGIDWKGISTKVLSEIYIAAGRESPEWINYFVEEKQLSDSKEDIDLILRGFLSKMVNETYNKHYRTISGPDKDTDVPNQPFSHRLNFCLDHRLIPFLNKGINAEKIEEIIFTADIMQEVKQIKMSDSISSLAEIARIISGFEYGQKKLGSRNVRAAYGPKVKFLNYLDQE